MKITLPLYPLPAAPTASLSVQRPDRPRVLLMIANPVTMTTDPNQALPEMPLLAEVAIIAALPARREITGYCHGGIND